MTTPECEHFNRKVVSFDEGTPRRAGAITAHMICKDCGATFDMLTTRTAAEIQAEIEASA